MPMNVDEIVELSRKRGDIRFDDEICKDGSLKEIDPEKIKRFLQIARVKRDFPLSKEIQVRDALYHLNLIKNEKITNAAVLLFGKNPQRFHLQAETKCIAYRPTQFYSKSMTKYQLKKHGLSFVNCKVK